MLIRISGLILICCCVSLIGFIFCDKLYFRKRQLEAIELFAAICHEEMRTTGKNVFDIFKKHGTKELYFLNYINCDNIHNSHEITDILNSHSFNENDASIIAEFIISLGTGDIKSEEEHCRFYERKFCEIKKEVEKEISEKCRLYKSLFMFAGAALFILLI